MICLKCGKSDFTTEGTCKAPRKISPNNDDWICMATEVPKQQMTCFGMPSMFWIVWSPQGLNPPTFMHKNMGSAIGESERLAKKNPGDVFFVMEVKRGVVQSGECNFKFDIDDIPF